MTTQKEHIEKLETDVHEIKESTQRLEQSMKETIATALKEAMAFASTETEAEPPHQAWETMASHSPPQHCHAHHHRKDGHSYQPMKMEFPRFHDDDPIVWLDRATQFFEYQHIGEGQKITLATFYLEGEANQWWQWLKNVYLEDGQPITWEIFEKEILVRFWTNGI
jgi:hypothetical protein